MGKNKFNDGTSVGGEEGRKPEGRPAAGGGFDQEQLNAIGAEITRQKNERGKFTNVDWSSLENPNDSATSETVRQAEQAMKNKTDKVTGDIDKAVSEVLEEDIGTASPAIEHALNQAKESMMAQVLETKLRIKAIMDKAKKLIEDTRRMDNKKLGESLLAQGQAEIVPEQKPIGQAKYKGKTVDIYARDEKGNVLADVPVAKNKKGDTEKQRIWIDHKFIKEKEAKPAAGKEKAPKPAKQNEAKKPIGPAEVAREEQPTVNDAAFESMMAGAAGEQPAIEGEVAPVNEAGNETGAKAVEAEPALAEGITPEPTVTPAESGETAGSITATETEAKPEPEDFIPDKINEGQVLRDTLKGAQRLDRKLAERRAAARSTGENIQTESEAEAPFDFAPTAPDGISDGIFGDGRLTDAERERIAEGERIAAAGAEALRQDQEERLAAGSAIPSFTRRDRGFPESPRLTASEGFEASATQDLPRSTEASRREVPLPEAPRTPESGPTAPRPEVDLAYREYTTRRNVFIRFFAHKWDKVKNWTDRFTGKNSDKGVLEINYGIAQRSFVRISNFFAGKLFDFRNNAVIKSEERLGDLRSRINELEGQNQANKDIRDNPSYSKYERIAAAKEYNAGFKKLNALRAESAKRVSKLRELETLKEDCLNGINERAQAVSRDIEERVAPMKAKLSEANLVLTEAQKNRDDWAAKREAWQQKLTDLEVRLVSVPKSERGLVKSALAQCRRELKNYDVRFDKANKELAICQENIGHLEALINPWDDLATAYQDISQKETYRSSEEKPKYASVGDRAYEKWSRGPRESYPSEEGLRSLESPVKLGKYLQELTENFGLSISELTDREKEEIMGRDNDNSELVLSEVQDRIRPILLAKGIREDRINSLFNQTRINYRD